MAEKATDKKPNALAESKINLRAEADSVCEAGLRQNVARQARATFLLTTAASPVPEELLMLSSPVMRTINAGIGRTPCTRPAHRE
jgi:hypothetical protein